MPLSEYDAKEALRAATDWLVASELPGSAAAREGDCRYDSAGHDGDGRTRRFE
jgi:hypothetical protein